MRSLDFRKLLKKNLDFEWILIDESFLPKFIKNKDYIKLICKRCGNKKKHTVGNLKHALTHNIKHCRCLKCADKAKKNQNEREHSQKDPRPSSVRRCFSLDNRRVEVIFEKVIRSQIFITATL